MNGKRRVGGAPVLLTGVLSLVAFSHNLLGQCTGEPPRDTGTIQIQQLFEQNNWEAVVRLAGPVALRSADMNFEYGLALAHLQRWREADAALLAGDRACPGQKRFAVELAGVAFETKSYPEAAAWLRRALKLDPKDNYANDFAGTVYLLMGNLNAALKFWNRIENPLSAKPQIAALDFDPQIRLRRLILDRAFAFSPAALLTERDYETTEARLKGLGVFPVYNVELDAAGDGRFNAVFHAQERDGFGGNWMQAVVSTFGGAEYATIYPSYFNIGKSAANVESLLRWGSQKRRAWVSISAPLNDRPQLRWRLEGDARNENWAIRRSFTGTAPVLGSLNLERETVAGAVTGIPNGRLQWSTGVELSHRSYRNVAEGTALTAALVEPGYGLKALGSVEGSLLEIPERRFRLSAGASSELARLWPAGKQVTDGQHAFGKLEGRAGATLVSASAGRNV